MVNLGVMTRRGLQSGVDEGDMWPWLLSWGLGKISMTKCDPVGVPYINVPKAGFLKSVALIKTLKILFST